MSCIIGGEALACDDNGIGSFDLSFGITALTTECFYTGESSTSTARSNASHGPWNSQTNSAIISFHRPSKAGRGACRGAITAHKRSPCDSARPQPPAASKERPKKSRRPGSIRGFISHLVLHCASPRRKRAPLARGSSVGGTRDTRRYLLPAFSCCSFGSRCAGVCWELPWPLVEGLLAPSFCCDGVCC
jgi:hypothetical protein